MFNSSVLIAVGSFMTCACAWGAAAPSAAVPLPRLSLCATIIENVPCHPELETECSCRNNGHCSKFDYAEETHSTFLGEDNQFVWEDAFCICTYRCLQLDTPTVYCVYDTDCVKDWTHKDDCPYLEPDHAVLTGCPCGGCS